MKMIPNWRQAWRWWSVRVSAIGALLSAAALAAPDALLSAWHVLPLDRLPPRVVFALQLLMLLLVIATRLIAQPKAEVSDGE